MSNKRPSFGAFASIAAAGAVT
ncbi:hypothetical protein LCGC14_2761250, partial [marine sediment metagenome]